MKTFGITALSAAGLLMASAATAETSATAMTDLNLRADPNPAGEILTVIPSDGEVQVEGCAAEAKWCQVSYDGQEGWAYGDYLVTRIGEEPAVLNEHRQAAKITVIERSADTTGISAGVGGATGALVGGLIGGPAGLVAGAALGAGTGAAADVGQDVTTYVIEHPVDPVYVEGEVVSGAVLPEAVELHPVPDSGYSYVYVNNVPVVVGEDRQVVTIVR